MKKRLNKPFYLGLSILKISKIVMYEFWYDYAKPKYDRIAKPCYLGTDSFIIYIKKYYIYNDIAEDIETTFDTSNYELKKPLPKGNNKKVIEDWICRMSKNLYLPNRWR